MASLQEKCPDNAGPAAPTPTPTPVPVPAPCVIPAFAEACALLDAPYSCLVLDGHRRHVALPPVYLRKKKRGIREELSAELLKYSDSMKGVPLAFDDIKVVGPHADILDDQGYVHMNIEATFVVFKPKRGQKLKGVVNKLGQTHVGCLVHGCFNASVLKPGSLSVEAWRDSGLKVGDDLEFEVANLDADAAGVLLIRGRLTKSRIEELLSAAEAPEPVEPQIETVEGVKKHKKKKDKRPEKHERQEEEELADSGLEVSQMDESVVQEKKKRKKEKRRKVEGSDSSGYLSEKSSRKRKEVERDDVTDNAETLNVKKKKKKC
ncbi:DNA-directed RNA polymerase I subunit RPA43-like [Denticeps clupeoides]|uniref:DNA-directed RNA polymerase subunit n=1 Tax=Denticeps clupeoides TaxID=299321 RepID=A0AAY4DAR0_9TELE|nr:DNA-directed RNA polymerase I subunit RPA43-like [Denticeps clupeoides]